MCGLSTKIQQTICFLLGPQLLSTKMEVILDDLASKSRVLYEEGKFKEVEEMFNTFIKESG